MKKVWAEFEVNDHMEPSDVALALELRFGGDGDTATVWQSPGDAILDINDGLRAGVI